MWSLGLLAYSWLFLQTIGSAHFSRGMSNDRPVEPIGGQAYHSSEIRFSVNFTKPGKDGRRRESSRDIISIWEQPEIGSNILIEPTRPYPPNGEKIIVEGLLVFVRNMRGSKEVNDGCSKPLNPGSKKWIAVVKDEGGCKHDDVIRTLLQDNNASSVIIIGKDGENHYKSQRRVDYNLGKPSRRERVAVWMKSSVLTEIRARCSRNQTCTASLRITINSSEGIINRTSVLFVSISFILLMIISLAWLVFYYVQRFRYIHAKERLSRRLANAAKKALTRIPVKTLLRGDPETENEYDQCAVCIEQYKTSDTIRILPCRHYFHKSCIDPWLLEQRSCPMCKLDILKAYGLQVRGFSEGPSDTLGDHSEVNGLGARATSVSLETTGAREVSPDLSDRPCDETEGGGVEESRSNSSAVGGVASTSPSASPGGIRVTIEPPEVQYHNPETTVEVVVEQHRPRGPRPAEEEEDEDEDEEAAASRPLVADGGGPGPMLTSGGGKEVSGQLPMSEC